MHDFQTIYFQDFPGQSDFPGLKFSTKNPGLSMRHGNPVMHYAWL